jgi:hypothetical protein
LIHPSHSVSLPFVLFSLIADGDRVTLPNDPSNLARALVLLEQNKLLTLKSGIDPIRASGKDIDQNPWRPTARRNTRRWSTPSSRAT